MLRTQTWDWLSTPVHHDGSAGLVSHTAHSAGTTQEVLCHKPSSSHSQSCCPSSPPKSHDFAERQLGSPSVTWVAGLPFENESRKAAPKGPQLPHLLIYFPSRRDFRELSCDSVKWRVGERQLFTACQSDSRCFGNCESLGWTLHFRQSNPLLQTFWALSSRAQRGDGLSRTSEEAGSGHGEDADLHQDSQAPGKRVGNRTIGSRNLQATRQQNVKKECSRGVIFPKLQGPGEKRTKGHKRPFLV